MKDKHIPLKTVGEADSSTHQTKGEQNFETLDKKIMACTTITQVYNTLEKTNIPITLDSGDIVHEFQIKKIQYGFLGYRTVIQNSTTKPKGKYRRYYLIPSDTLSNREAHFWMFDLYMGKQK